MSETRARAATQSHAPEKAEDKRRRPDSTSSSVNATAGDTLLIDTFLGGSFTDPRLDRHTAILSDPRFSHSANSARKAEMVSGLQAKYGNVYVQRLLKSQAVQAKLTVNHPDDQYEQEADRVADAVTRAPVSQVQRQEEEQLQARPLSDVQRKKEEEEELQAKSAEGQPGVVSKDLEKNIGDARGAGHPLSDIAGEPMEKAFGADFGGVRAHTDSEANALAKQLGARAFTTGHDVFLGSGEYQPESDEGRKLLAHEITHVVQQGATDVSGKPADREVRPRILGTGGDVPVGLQVVQRQISTPLGEYVEKVEKGKSAKFKVGNTDVVVKEDVKVKKALRPRQAKTGFRPKLSVPKPVEYDKSSGKITKLKGSPNITYKMQTRYGKMATPEMPSAYGKGPTLGEHEGAHGTDFLEYLKANPPPEFEGKEGMTTKEYRQAKKKWKDKVDAYTKKIEKYSKERTDCVGKKAHFCSADEGAGGEEKGKVQKKAAGSEIAERIQRQALQDEEQVQGKLQRQAAPEEEEAQTKATASSVPEVTSDLEDRISAARGGGQALPDSLRSSIEPELRHDFSQVRLHTDAEADALSRELGAKAFTRGQDVFFRSGDYQPHSDEGRRLLGHELTHVVQQATVLSIAQKVEKPKKGKTRKTKPLATFTSEELSLILGTYVESEEPPAPRFSLIVGNNFSATLDGKSLNPILFDRVISMAEYALRNRLVTANIVLNSGIRSPRDAHKLSTAYHTIMGKVPLKNLQALRGGTDEDKNHWYDSKWERGGKATPKEIMEKAIENARSIANQTSPANEGYTEASKRAPNIEVPVTRHATGLAIDATICWEWSKGKKSQEQVMDPKKLEAAKKQARKIKNKTKRESVLKNIDKFEARGAYSAIAEETAAKFGLSRPVLHAREGPEDWHYQLAAGKK